MNAWRTSLPPRRYNLLRSHRLILFNVVPCELASPSFC